MIIDMGVDVQNASNVNWSGPVRPGALAVDLLVAGLMLAGVTVLCEKWLRRGGVSTSGA